MQIIGGDISMAGVTHKGMEFGGSIVESLSLSISLHDIMLENIVILNISFAPELYLL